MADAEKSSLLYACSGCANVAEAADQACRRLGYEGRGSMFCLAGVAAGIPAMVDAARSAEINVLVDGCAMDCAKRCFDNAGLTNYVQIRVTDLGVEKVKGVAASDEEIAVVVRRIQDELAAGENQSGQ